MAIESIPPINKLLPTDSINLNDKKFKPMTKNATSSKDLDADIKRTIDSATGLLQSIVTEKISDKVLRKIPSDEYLHLLSLLDEIVQGSINKRI